MTLDLKHLYNCQYSRVYPEAFCLTLIKENRQDKVKSKQTLFITLCVKYASSKVTTNMIGRENCESKSSEHLISVDKKNSITTVKSFISALDFDWQFSRLIELSVFFDDARYY